MPQTCHKQRIVKQDGADDEIPCGLALAGDGAHSDVHGGWLLPGILRWMFSGK